MAAVEELRAQHRERLNKALRLEKADKIPVVIMGPIPCAKLADSSIVVADAVENHEYFLDKAFEGLDILKDVDTIQGFSSALSRVKGLNFMSKVKLPGVELERDTMIQIWEQPHMAFDDYYTVLDKGWNEFKKDYITNRLGIVPEDYDLRNRFGVYAMKKIAASEYVDWGGGASPMPWDLLTSMRGMLGFFKDLKKYPKLIKDVMAAISSDESVMFEAALKKGTSAFSFMVQPGVRSNCDFISRKTFEEFVWPYVMQYADKVIEAGIPVHFHYDAKWDDFLDLWKYFPKYTCIMDTDGSTDIYKVKEILGDRMAITGNTSPVLLALGTPDEVYNFVKKQIADLGEEGYIICSSCTIPSNCKPENLKAMVAACR